MRASPAGRWSHGPAFPVSAEESSRAGSSSHSRKGRCPARTGFGIPRAAARRSGSRACGQRSCPSRPCLFFENWEGHPKSKGSRNWTLRRSEGWLRRRRSTRLAHSRQQTRFYEVVEGSRKEGSCTEMSKSDVFPSGRRQPELTAAPSSGNRPTVPTCRGSDSASAL